MSLGVRQPCAIGIPGIGRATAPRPGTATPGMTVGLFDEYGLAQQLYGRRGYTPDGWAACGGQRPLSKGMPTTKDNDLTIRKAANGEVAELYAQRFPFKNAPALVSSVILHPAGTAVRYEFQVTPTLATRYRVEIFQSSTASTPLATSGIAIVYVALDIGTVLCTRGSRAGSSPRRHP